ncbi:TIGR04219 family outer membrane beta-barrel protein [Vibrio rumoiensis]|uniref:Fe3+-hydroxamate ABC transporter substrate-binding protein n=1 Tax=Vibrio rumoiensis 1S-45 TaxID=1188252 RepID=A0A1E5E1Q2_9VIBR|nr:TIGR04219 family outer membrane beta-barrel protein [Vibrio rumoiensis]OEF25166.1 hypothetical protein A1QC_09535 [Vibrio rumoiensis 1S-45]
MKKSIWFAVTLGGVLTTAAVQAENTWNTKVGMDYWWATNKVDEVKYQGDDPISAYVDFSHSLPYIPNFKLRYTQIDNSAISFNNIDYIAYYPALHTDSVAFNIGISASQFQSGEYRQDGIGSSQSFNEVAWALYADGRLIVPGTQFSLIGDMQFGGTGDNSTADVMVGLDYVFKLDTVDLSLRGGYRVMDYSFDYFTGEPVEVREQGFFTGVELNF